MAGGVFTHPDVQAHHQKDVECLHSILRSREYLRTLQAKTEGNLSPPVFKFTNFLWLGRMPAPSEVQIGQTVDDESHH